MVRIVFQPKRSKGALASLLAVFVAAASIWASYWVWYRHDQDVPAHRTPPDFRFQWLCPNGHVFEAQGAYGTLPCPTCGQPAHIVITYECPEHGTRDLLVIFGEVTEKPTYVQYEPDQWFAVSDRIPCWIPSCRHDVHQKWRDPLRGSGTAEKRKAGGDSAGLP